jgi:chemotaxis protein MotB
MSGEDNRRKLKKNIREEVHAELWLITYADLITLLLCFFILLFASANVDQNVWDRVKASYSSKVKNKTISTPLSEIKHQLDSMLMKEVKDKSLEIENKDNAINMRFLSNSFYNSGDAKLLPEGKEIVDKIFEIINAVSKEKKANFSLDVEGHTDDNPIATKEFPSNWELSVARASNVVRYLIDRGMEPQRLKASGYADTQPVVSNRNGKGEPIPANQSVNRRVVLRIHY